MLFTRLNSFIRSTHSASPIFCLTILACSFLAMRRNVILRSIEILVHYSKLSPLKPMNIQIYLYSLLASPTRKLSNVAMNLPWVTHLILGLRTMMTEFEKRVTSSSKRYLFLNANSRARMSRGRWTSHQQ
jgi:succinate dehydrogenase/fumarate reductase cytochrome b subunit